MNRSKIFYVVSLAAAILVGLGLGYLLFFNTGNQSAEKGSSVAHNHERVEEEQTWTCSMHPQIRQNEPGVCPICEMDLIPLEANSSTDPLVLEMTPEAVKLAQIETTLIGTTGSADKSLSLSGKIQTDERLVANQVAHIPGRIEKLFVTFTGEQVKQGQDLAVIYSPDLVSAQQELLEAKKLESINPSLVQSARKKLTYWKISEKEIAAIEKSGQIQEQFTLKAEVSGVVNQRRVAIGDYVQKGEILFDIISLNKVWVLFDAYEEDLASIKLGDQISFTTTALPNQTFSTRVSFIDPMINPDTRVAAVRGEIRNAGLRLKPEMLVRGEIRASIPSGQQLLVPRSAVLWTGPRSVVYVKVPDTSIPSYQFREIEVGERVGDNYLIAAGLSAGEEVVTYGNFTIDAAAQLNNQASMMNRNVMEKGADHSQHLPDYTADATLIFKQELATVTNTYLSLKDAFVATDSTQASRRAKQLVADLAQVDMSEVKGEAHNYWMNQSAAIQTHAQRIAELTNIEDQRMQFDFLSQAIITSIKVFGVPEDTYYIQHCPMAFDNVGADWISDVEEIRNPYFGDRMLKCGLVQETIDANFKNPPASSTASRASSGHNH